jgi:hypothetical protein
MFDFCFRGFFRARMRGYSRDKPGQAKMRSFYNRFRFPLSICGIVLGLSGISFACVAEESPAIAAASDLKFALEMIAKQFPAETGLNVKEALNKSFNKLHHKGGPSQGGLWIGTDER